MTQYLYVGADARAFPDSTFVTAPGREPKTVEPGDLVDADANPDPRFFDEVPSSPPAAPKTTAVAPPAPEEG